MSNQLFVIAGPNGAGKSTSSAEILKKYNITAFDWDFEFYSVWKKFDFDPLVEEGVRSKTSEKLQQLINKSLASKQSFSYETNFHQEYSFEIAHHAKEKGFETNLIFLLVDAIDICIKRVEKRYNSGGHFVDEKTIENRFFLGLKNLNVAIEYFDNIFLFDTSIDYKVKSVLTVRNKEIIRLKHPIPQSVIEHLPNLK